MCTPTPNGTNSPLLSVICTIFTRIVYTYTIPTIVDTLTIADNFLFDSSLAVLCWERRRVLLEIRHVFVLPLLSRPDQTTPSRRYGNCTCLFVGTPLTRVGKLPIPSHEFLLILSVAHYVVFNKNSTPAETLSSPTPATTSPTSSRPSTRRRPTRCWSPSTSGTWTIRARSPSRRSSGRSSAHTGS